MAGITSINGASTLNIFLWNPITERHEVMTPYTPTMYHTHEKGDCTALPADAKILRRCNLGYVQT